jgi:hypothetical protein
MPKISNYLALVKDIYEHSIKARDNDAVLIAYAMERILGAEWKTMQMRTYLLMVFRGQAPSMDTITRAGRSVREHHPELRGSAKAQERRDNERLTTLQDLEYHTPRDNPSQLPLPL